jgi:Uma2 family endonuclease
VAYVSEELVAKTGDDARIYEGPPLLAVEILSPSDTHEDIASRITLYLRAGCAVWIIDPDVQTVTVYRSGQQRKSSAWSKT